MPDASNIPETEALTTNLKPKRSLAAMLFVVGGLVAGGAAGAFVSGPLLAKKLAPRTPADSAVAAERAKAEDTVGAASAPVHLLDNLVLNPAGSGATRFLLVSVGVQTANTASADRIKAREIEARDAVLRVLGGKPVDDLANTTHRDGFKREIEIALDSLFGKGFVKRVYFSQFVIQ